MEVMKSTMQFIALWIIVIPIDQSSSEAPVTVLYSTIALAV